MFLIPPVVLGSFNNDYGDGNVTIKKYSYSSRQTLSRLFQFAWNVKYRWISHEAEFLRITPKFRQRKKNSSPGMLTSSIKSHTVTAKKCTKSVLDVQSQCFAIWRFFIIQSILSTSPLLEFPNWLLWYGVKNYYDCETYTYRFNERCLPMFQSLLAKHKQFVPGNSFSFFETGKASSWERWGICFTLTRLSELYYNTVYTKK